MNGEESHDAGAVGGRTPPSAHGSPGAADGKEDHKVDEYVRAFLARLGAGEIPAPTEEQMASLRKLAANGNGPEARAPKGGE